MDMIEENKKKRVKDIETTLQGKTQQQQLWRNNKKEEKIKKN